MPKDRKIALIQMSCDEDLDKNLAKALSRIEEAAGQGAKIVCLPELFKSRYFCQVEHGVPFAYAEPVDEDAETVRKLRDVASKCGVVVIASLFEKRGPGINHNTAVVIDADGAYLGKYRQMHVPDAPEWHEKFYFTPGDLGYKVFKIRYADIGVLICWDQWFPEAARLTALKGAQIIFYPTAIGHSVITGGDTGVGGPTSWQTVQRGHAVANACYVAAVNRVGFEPNSVQDGGLDFWGQSFVSDLYGNIVESAPADKEEIVYASVDLSIIEETRNISRNYFRDRRVDSYGGLTEVYLGDGPSPTDIRVPSTGCRRPPLRRFRYGRCRSDEARPVHIPLRGFERRQACLVFGLVNDGR